MNGNAPNSRNINNDIQCVVFAMNDSFNYDYNNKIIVSRGSIKLLELTGDRRDHLSIDTLDDYHAQLSELQILNLNFKRKVSGDIASLSNLTKLKKPKMKKLCKKKHVKKKNHHQIEVDLLKLIETIFKQTHTSKLRKKS